MRHITRFDYGRTRGWWVRIHRQPNPCSKLFSDGKHGGTEQALEAAKAWRDEMLKDRPMLGHRQRESATKKIPTGVVGLYVGGEKKGEKAKICVSLIDWQGKHVGTHYSVAKWGLRKALWKACVVLAQGREEDKQKAQKLAQEYYDKSFKNISAHFEGKQQPAAR